jgi:hypothetical protein
MAKSFKEAVDKIKPLLTEEIFKIPIEQKGNNSFPLFLKQELDNYIDSIKKSINIIINNTVDFDTGNKNVVLNKITFLSDSLICVLNNYYEGKIFEATKKFNDALDEILYNELKNYSAVPLNDIFYRARKDNDKHLNKEDLFHIKFEDRVFVSTNRYSIPGFPALYLGESTYVCWEEYGRYNHRKLWYSKVESTEHLKVISIQRLDDFLEEIEPIFLELQLSFILRYLITFPLSIACSVKVKNTNASFKPEYIIPQLLLQYVSKYSTIDGIKFPSTKINYQKLKGVPSYNYVFPVKTNKEKGFCDFLINAFSITEPTSIEVEEVINNPYKINSVFGSIEYDKEKYFELINGVQTLYDSSSFGKIEKILNTRELNKITNT